MDSRNDDADLHALVGVGDGALRDKFSDDSIFREASVGNLQFASDKVFLQKPKNLCAQGIQTYAIFAEMAIPS